MVYIGAIRHTVWWVKHIELWVKHIVLWVGRIMWWVGHTKWVEHTSFEGDIEWWVGHTGLQVGSFKGHTRRWIGHTRRWVGHNQVGYIEFAEHIGVLDIGRTGVKHTGLQVDIVRRSKGDTEWWVGHNWCSWF